MPNDHTDFHIGLLLTLGGLKGASVLKRMGASSHMQGAATSPQGVNYYFHGVHFPDNKLSSAPQCSRRRRRQSTAVVTVTEVAAVSVQYPWVNRNVECNPSATYYAAYPAVPGTDLPVGSTWHPDAPTGQCVSYTVDCQAGEKVRDGTGELLFKSGVRYPCTTQTKNLSLADPRAVKSRFTATTGQGKVGTCVFPFAKNGVTYTTCAQTETYGGVGWCAFHSNFQAGEWGYCTESCPGGTSVNPQGPRAEVANVPRSYLSSKYHATPIHVSAGCKDERHTGWLLGKKSMRQCAYTCRDHSYFTMDTIDRAAFDSTTRTSSKKYRCKCDDTCMKTTRQTSFKYARPTAANKWKAVLPSCWETPDSYCKGAFKEEATSVTDMCPDIGVSVQRHTGWLAPQSLESCAHTCRTYPFFTLDATVTAGQTGSHACKCDDRCDATTTNGQSAYANTNGVPAMVGAAPVNGVTRRMDCWASRPTTFCSGARDTLVRRDYDADGAADALCTDSDGEHKARLSTNGCVTTHLSALAHPLAVASQANGVAQPHTLVGPHPNRACDACPSGQFASGLNSLSCTPHTICTKREYVSFVGNRQHVDGMAAMSLN